MRTITGAALGALTLWLCSIVATPTALAHPLGNFTINRYCRVELTGSAVRLRYVLDLAEIPSVQETRAADSDNDGTVTPVEWDLYKLRKAMEISQQLDLT